MNGHQLPLPPPPKRRKLGFDTTRLLEVPLPATLPYEELMLPRVLPGAPAAVEQDHLDSMRKALMNDTLLPEEEASDGDFRPGLDEGSDDSRGSDMDVTSDEDEGYDVTIPVHRSVIKGAGPTAGQGGLIEALTNPRSRSVAATDEPVQNGAQNDTTPQELVSPRYQPSSPGIRVPTPPPMASTKNVISPKPAIPATAVASTSSSSVSSSSSSDSSSSSSSNESDSSSSSSSSSSDSSSSSSSDNDDEEPNTSAMLKPVNPQPRLVNGNTAKKTLAGLVKSAPPGQGKSRTANRNMRRRRAKALKNAALGTESSNAPTIGPQRPAGADEDVAAAKAAALSVLDRVAQTDQQEDSAAALAASKKLKDKAAQRKAEVISQNDLHHQLQAHYRQQQHSNYVVPPSQKEIPANVFVTSIDVEQPEWASHGDVEDGLGEVEGIAEDQEEYASIFCT